MPRALYLLALAVFAMGTSEFMLAGLVPDIATGLGVSVGAAGLLTSAFAAGMVIGAPLMAAFARRWPARAALLIFVTAFAVAHIASAVTSSFVALLVARVVAALANAGFLAVALRTATAMVAADRRGRALAVLLGGTTMATVLGVPGGALLGTVFGWRATFWAIAMLCVPAAIGIAASVRGQSGKADTAEPTLRAELALLRSGPLIAVMALGALVNGATFAAFTFLAPVVTETAGLAPIWVTLALMLFGVGSFLGVSLAGRLSDHRPGPVLAVGGPLLVLGWLTLAMLAGHPWLLLVLVFAQGVLAFAVGSTLIARVLYAAAGAPTMGGSYATAALNLGAACGPAIGALSLASGTLGPIWVAAGLSGIALLAALPLWRLVTGPTAGSPAAR